MARACADGHFEFYGVQVFYHESTKALVLVSRKGAKSAKLLLLLISRDEPSAPLPAGEGQGVRSAFFSPPKHPFTKPRQRRSLVQRLLQLPTLA